jgi:hypothetical protein
MAFNEITAGALITREYANTMMIISVSQPKNQQMRNRQVAMMTLDVR